MKEAHIKICVLNTMKNSTQNGKLPCWQIDERNKEGSTFPSAIRGDEIISSNSQKPICFTKHTAYMQEK